MLLKGKKSLVILLSVCFMLTSILFTGCGKTENASKNDATKTTEQTVKAADGTKSADPVKISFMGWGGPEEKKTFTELTNKFMQKYPNVKVDYINVPADNFMVKLQTMVAGNKAPDSFYFPPDYLLRWVSSGSLLNLTPYMQNSEIFKEDNVWPRLLDRYKSNGKEVGVGDIYALPKDVGPFALAYNKKLFQEAGITAPDPNTAWTHEEFIANAKKLTKGSGNDKQFGVADYNFESAIWSHGGDFLDSTRTKIAINEPNFIAGFQFYADLMLKHKVAPTRTESEALGNVQRWLNGKVAMIGMGPWHQAQFWTAPFEWDLMRWPVKNAGDPSVVWYGSMGFAVSPKSEFKQEAFNLIAYLAFDRDGQKTNYEMGQAVPNLIDMAKNEYMNMDKAPKSKQVFIDIIEKYGRPAAGELTFQNDWLGEFWGSWEAVNRGEKSAEQFVKEAQPKMQKLLDVSVEKMKAAK